MKVLLISPEFPDSFWTFKHALRFIGKKAAEPPLGLITMSAMLPAGWDKKLVDMNVGPLFLDDIRSADYVFISAMRIQQESVRKIIDACVKLGTRIVAGGPLFTRDYEDYPMIDHLLLNEAELTLPLFLRDLSEGNPKQLYRAQGFTDLGDSPVPDFHLLARKRYASMSIQVSRGFPYNCDFCGIAPRNGTKVRTKTTQQVVAELDSLYALKWRGPVFIVDDNFIGNREVIKHSILPAMKNWMKNHGYPFTFTTEAAINLADDKELMLLMAATGINSVFVGIGTPEETSLNKCKKILNLNRDLIRSIRKIQHAGMQVAGGFIVGFDHDTPSVFERQIDFIQQSGIVSAMVGLLNAPRQTPLYQRLDAEDRLKCEITINNADFPVNFISRMNDQELMAGYQKILYEIYSAKAYNTRIKKFLLNYRPAVKGSPKITWNGLMAFVKSLFIIGVLHKGRREYWRLLIWTLYRDPAMLVDAVTFSIYGYHFRKVFGI